MEFEPLHYHAMSGNYLRVQSLLIEGIDPDGKNPSGETPLMLAAKGSHREVAELLINSGADVHCWDNLGWTALHHASFQGSVEIVRCLVNKGAALDKKNSDGNASWMLAAGASHREVVELLIDSGSADIHCCDDKGWSMLHYASRNGWVEIVQWLGNEGADPNAKSCYDGTPLMLAAWRSHREVVELLIKFGADIHCNDNGTVLHSASYGGSVDIVQSIVDKGVALDVKNDLGQTPLMLAVGESHREVVELLVKSGADIHCCDDYGWTVLHHASAMGSLEMVQFLVNIQGVAIDGKNTVGKTSLMFAVRRSRREIAELLIESGADIHCCDDYGWTMLHHASNDGGSVEIVQFLVNKGVSLDMKNNDCETPLRFAVERHELDVRGIDVVDYFLKAGADCNLEDDKGESPFNYLIREKGNNVETIKLCIEKGAYVNAADYNNLLGNPLLKKEILQDVKVCSQAVINKFNNRDLPLLYAGIASPQELPRINELKILNESRMALEVEQCVSQEIQTKGFCNLLEMVPLVLGILCVKSSIEKSRPVFNQASRLESQNDLKRSGYFNEQEYPYKKMCN